METKPPHEGNESHPARIGPSVARQSLDRTVELLRLLDEGQPLRLAADEAAPTRNVVLEICRRRNQLEWYLAQLADKGVKPRLRRYLCWALAEILWFDGLSAEVAANICVEAVKRQFSSREAGFVNALLRRSTGPDARARFAESLAKAPLPVRLALPESLWKRWRKRFPAQQLEGLANLLRQPSVLHVRQRQTVGECSFLGPVFTVPWGGGAEFRLCHDPATLFASPEWRAGAFYVQDPATLLACSLLAARPGEMVADLCAAPGGKALALAEAVGPTGRLVALDRSLRRLRPLVRNLSAQTNCLLAAGDAAQPPFRPASFAAVLLDVPCSNTGVIRKNPDVRWRFSEADLASLVALQGRILAGAAALVQPGGRLVYSTCSIEPEENEQNVAAFLANHPDFALVEQRQLLPAEEHDGAFAALLVRKN
jgi:16S rRNA (cytosine967-C5)-methyltransferase